jgi:hypothetical protein
MPPAEAGAARWSQVGRRLVGCRSPRRLSVVEGAARSSVPHRRRPWPRPRDRRPPARPFPYPRPRPWSAPRSPAHAPFRERRCRRRKRWEATRPRAAHAPFRERRYRRRKRWEATRPRAAPRMSVRRWLGRVRPLRRAPRAAAPWSKSTVPTPSFGRVSRDSGGITTIRSSAARRRRAMRCVKNARPLGAPRDAVREDRQAARSAAPSGRASCAGRRASSAPMVGFPAPAALRAARGSGVGRGGRSRTCRPNARP